MVLCTWPSPEIWTDTGHSDFIQKITMPGIDIVLGAVHKWLPPKNLKILTPSPPLPGYVLNVPLQKDVTNSYYALPLNPKDFLLLKAQFARKYTQC